jgi:F-type H+-transporting ATPase subunit epsilon
MATLHCTIANVSETLFDGAVDSVTVPGTSGEMTIMAHHAPLISPLKDGTITVKIGGDKKTYTITGGVLEISENHASILV